MKFLMLLLKKHPDLFAKCIALIAEIGAAAASDPELAKEAAGLLG